METQAYYENIIRQARAELAAVDQMRSDLAQREAVAFREIEDARNRLAEMGVLR